MSNQISTELISNNIDVDNKKQNLKDKSKESTIVVKRAIPSSVTPISSISPLPSWTFLTSKALASDGTPVCAGISAGWTTPGTQVIAWQINSNDNSQLYQTTSDGRLLSRLTSNYVLDVTSNLDLIANDISNIDTQQWVFSNGQISNAAYTGNCIGMKGAIDSPITPSNGVELIIAKPTSNDNPCFQWETSPSYPLNSILTQPAQPFPQYSGSLLNDYIDISQQLAGVNDIRSEYTNLTQSLSSYQTRLQEIASNYPVELTSQLFNEFEYAQTIINLFNCYSSFHTELFADNSARLNQLIALCQIEQGSDLNISGCMLSVFSGLLYTILCAIPGAEGAVAIAPIVANIIQTGINIGVSASSSSTTISPDPFQVAISNLWGILSSNFEALLATTGTMETLLLTDWGMMQAAYTLTNKVNTPDSLAWSTTMTSDIINAAIPGYENSVLQSLMPSKYQIYRWDTNSTNNNGMNHPDDIPSYCQWSYAGLIYWISDLGYTAVYPSEDLMNTLWNSNNVSKQDFFMCQNGWNFPTAYVNGNYSNGTVSIGNNTSVPMKFQIAYDKSSTANFNLPTYSTTLSLDPAAATGSWTSTFEVTVWDLSDSYIASLNIYVDTKFLKGSYISLKDSYIKPGYYLGSPICNEGSLGDGFTASIIVPIYQSPSN